VLGSKLDERRLLARIGVNDSGWRNFQIKNFLYLTLKNAKSQLKSKLMQNGKKQDKNRK